MLAAKDAEWLQTIRVVIWPALVLLLLCAAIFTKRGRAFFHRTVHKVTAFGVEVSLDSDTATDVKLRADELFQTYRSIITAELERAVKRQRLERRVAAVVRDHVVPYLDEGAFTRSRRSEVRCTVYVPDALFESALCQLTDYFGVDGEWIAGGHGRAFTVRFGLIGLVWRLGTARVEREVTKDRDQLVREWGMTRNEAATAAHGRQAFAAVTIYHDHDPVALFYADGFVPGTFGTSESEEALSEIVRKASEATGLTRQLFKLQRRLESRGPRIDVFTQ